ncbi:NitT/TauT family transport system ATP-binding protein [Cohaesibacter marisflavi]|uniref:NitT/TauT family transport system ATP-binding protein n=2 Tax=Cohaesibacter marisflavi TaxID=655353 RepID=A0A1I5M961_9HYPH|nr:NitT/TauT family transport system ATP-binding protein [Cohaesibacter marisflavi]
MFKPSQRDNEIRSGTSSSQRPRKKTILHLRLKEHRYLPIEQVLDACELKMAPGEIVSLIGPSGCGKTTLVKIAAGLISPSDGSVERNTDSGAVLFQDHRLLPWKRLYDNMAFGLKAAKLTRQEQFERVSVAAKAMGFSQADLKKFPAELSGGMKQRAAIARAMVTEPDLLFLDEPFSALDVGRRREMYRALLTEIESRACTVLMVTHDIFEALSLSDRVLVMAPDPGRVIKEVTIKMPLHLRTRQLAHELEAELLSDDMIADLFRMKNWEKVL